MIMETIAFKDVKVGDRIYHSGYYAPNSAWRVVTNIKTNGTCISLGVGVSSRESFDTRAYFCGHPDEGVAVKRNKQFQHEETGRIVESETAPNSRYYEIGAEM